MKGTYCDGVATEGVIQTWVEADCRLAAEYMAHCKAVKRATQFTTVPISGISYRPSQLLTLETRYRHDFLGSVNMKAPPQVLGTSCYHTGQFPPARPCGLHS